MSETLWLLVKQAVLGNAGRLTTRSSYSLNLHQKKKKNIPMNRISLKPNSERVSWLIERSDNVRIMRSHSLAIHSTEEVI